PPLSTPLPYTTLFRSLINFHLRLYDCYMTESKWGLLIVVTVLGHLNFGLFVLTFHLCVHSASTVTMIYLYVTKMLFTVFNRVDRDRKSTRLNSSHVSI